LCLSVTLMVVGEQLTAEFHQAATVEQAQQQRT
jgi:hypothetical protein